MMTWTDRLSMTRGRRAYRGLWRGERPEDLAERLGFASTLQLRRAARRWAAQHGQAWPPPRAAAGCRE